MISHIISNIIGHIINNIISLIISKIISQKYIYNKFFEKNKRLAHVRMLAHNSEKETMRNCACVHGVRNHAGWGLF